MKLATPEPIPDDAADGDIAKIWQQFGVAQTVQVLTGNDRFDAAMGIVERCEARDAEAVKKSRPRFLGVF